MMTRNVFALVMGDLLSATMAVGVTFLMFVGPTAVTSGWDSAAALPAFIAVLGISSFLLGLYKNDRQIERTAFRILVAAITSYLILSWVTTFVPALMYEQRFIACIAFATSFFAISQFFGHVICGIGKSAGFAERVLVIGTGPLAKRIGDTIAEEQNNFILSGYVNCASEPVLVAAKAIVGTEDKLIEAVQRERADKIVVSLTERRGVFPVQDILSCKLSGIDVIDAPSFYEKVTKKLLIENITPSWLIFSDGFRVTLGVKIAKRMFDVIAASFGLLLVLPFLPLIAVLIKLDSKGPVLFRQKRVGEGEKPFEIYKFRTMRNDAEKDGPVWAQENDPRVTRLGNFLRRSRIDEIPQLFNVLKGEMSLVGPRPERPEFIEELKNVVPFYSERHFVKPGVTGWAQVRYRYGASVEDAVEKLRYDLYYIKNLSLAFDFMIILETIKVVLLRRGSR